jgi:type IX secretion system PorP/SprF family membrane protein
MQSVKIKLISIIAILALGFSAHAQDLHFSQFYENNILRNPSLIGVFYGDYKVSMNYRSQWSSITKPFVTGQLSFESRIPINDEKNDFFSAGFMAYFDKAGSIDMKSMAIYPAVSFNKSLEDAHKSFISAGFTGGYIQRSFDPSKITVNNQYLAGYDPNLSTKENISKSKINYFDLGAGINFSSTGGAYNELGYSIGVSGYHFTQPNTSFLDNDEVKMDMKWNVNAGMTYRFNEQVGLIFQGNYAMQGSYSEIIAGGLINWKREAERADEPLFIVYGGVFFRVNDAVIPVLKLDYMRYSFGLSYDMNISTLKAATNSRGGYEVSIVKTGVFQSPKWEKSRTLCPHFW